MLHGWRAPAHHDARLIAQNGGPAPQAGPTLQNSARQAETRARRIPNGLRNARQRQATPVLLRSLGDVCQEPQLPGSRRHVKVTSGLERRSASLHSPRKSQRKHFIFRAKCRMSPFGRPASRTRWAARLDGSRIMGSWWLASIRGETYTCTGCGTLDEELVPPLSEAAQTVLGRNCRCELNFCSGDLQVVAGVLPSPEEARAVRQAVLARDGTPPWPERLRSRCKDAAFDELYLAPCGVPAGRAAV